MAVVASGTAAAQVIGIAFSPIITRLYGPEAFGVLGTYMAILAILTPLAALSYPIAIVLPKNDSDAKGLVYLSLKLSIVTSGLVTIVLYFVNERFLNLMNIGDVGSYIWYLPLAMLLSVWLAVAAQWAVRKKQFSLKARVSVISALLQNGLSSGIGVFAPFGWVLIAVNTLGQALNAYLYFLGFRKNKAFGEESNNKGITQKELAKIYGDFAYFRTPQIVLNAASQSMPVIMLTALFGPAAAGFYSLGRLVLTAPVGLLAQSVQTVFYPHFNDLILENRSGASLLIKSTVSLFTIGFIPFLVIMLWGPVVFDFVFGGNWKKAGELAQWLAIWLLFSLSARPAIAAIPVLNLQGAFLIFEIIAVIGRILSIYIAYSLYGTLDSVVILFSLVNTITYIVLIFWVIKKSIPSSN